MAVWERKLNHIVSCESSLLVDLCSGVNVTSSLSRPRISFPYPSHTPSFRVLDETALRAELNIPTDVSTLGIVSSLENVSSSCSGVCMVTSRVFILTNAHEGTHADQPLHFTLDSPIAQFPDAFYNGDVILCDVRQLLQDSSDGRKITREILQSLKLDLDADRVRRLVFRTYAALPAVWDAAYAYFDPEAAKYMADTFPHLVLVATDAPSMDHQDASPIVDKAHGMLWSRHIAILEGLDLSGVQRGREFVLQTVWNPMAQFPDARGCSCTLFPVRSSCT
eukprot:ANDGO_02424.mRNA.1 hypothetical protein DQ04_00091010